MKLTLTTDRLDALHAAADRNRKVGSMVRVPAGEFKTLLMDYGRLVGYARQHGLKIEETN